MNILTRITDWKIPCVYIHVYQITKNRGPGPYNSVRHAETRKYFSGRSLTESRREAHMIYIAMEVTKILRCSCWEKGNFVMINQFIYVKPEKFDHLHLVYHFTVPLNLSWRSKSMDWFLYDNGLRHERVKSLWLNCSGNIKMRYIHYC